MRVVTGPEPYTIQDGEISVFLAGGITNCPNWQKDIIDYFKDCKLPIVILNPRRDEFPINDEMETITQIAWEFNALEKCDIFSMYFAESESDQPICMYELGRNIVRMQQRFLPHDYWRRIVISVEDGYKRQKDVMVQTELACGHDFRINLGGKYNDLRDKHAEDIWATCVYLLQKTP